MGVLGVQTQHDYRRCRDESCQRYACRIYREAYRRGRDEGEAIGEARGHARGYAEGFPDGMAACPGPHSGG
jgi:hypothetical protein